MEQEARESAFQAALDALEKAKRKSGLGDTWTHLKSGRVYKVQGFCLIEATLEPAVIYQAVYRDDPMVWCRPAEEFFDGRFVFKPCM